MFNKKDSPKTVLPFLLRWIPLLLRWRIFMNLEWSIRKKLYFLRSSSRCLFNFRTFALHLSFRTITFEIDTLCVSVFNLSATSSISSAINFSGFLVLLMQDKVTWISSYGRFHVIVHIFDFWFGKRFNIEFAVSSFTIHLLIIYTLQHTVS